MTANLVLFMKPLSCSVVAILLTCQAFADGGDETLRYYLAKSELVVAGEVINEPFGIASEAGVVEYIFHFQVADVLQGNVVAQRDLQVTVIRFELIAGDELTWLRKGAKAILFLRKGTDSGRPGWVTVDVWFGAQPANSKMAKSLKRLSTEQEANRARPAEGVVMAYRDKLAVISVGSDDGIEAGQELYWYRGTADLGRLKVVSATADTATVEVALRIRPKFAPPRRNDRVFIRRP